MIDLAFFSLFSYLLLLERRFLCKYFIGIQKMTSHESLSIIDEIKEKNKLSLDQKGQHLKQNSMIFSMKT